MWHDRLVGTEHTERATQSLTEELRLAEENDINYNTLNSL